MAAKKVFVGEDEIHGASNTDMFECKLAGKDRRKQVRQVCGGDRHQELCINGLHKYSIIVI